MLQGWYAEEVLALRFDILAEGAFVVALEAFSDNVGNKVTVHSADVLLALGLVRLVCFFMLGLARSLGLVVPAFGVTFKFL